MTTRRKKEKKPSKDSEEDIPSDEESEEGKAAPVIISASSGGRRSGRLRQLSKKVKTVDKEARLEAQTARLELLENDNYGAAAPTALDLQPDDEEYQQTEDADEGFAKKKRPKKDRLLLERAKKTQKYVRNLNKLLEELQDSPDLPAVNYFTTAALPSQKPSRHFCSVCGLLASYCCTRCGMRFCSVKCNETHKDTRCLKFTM